MTLIEQRDQNWTAKYDALQTQIEDLEDQLEELENERCPECHELRVQHDSECEFADCLDEPVAGKAERRRVPSRPTRPTASIIPLSPERRS
jgi:hypothetical protein